jgi:hypothetical protein
MRLLFAIVLALALAWSGWWYYGATSRRAAIEEWLAERRAEGWVAEADEVRVTGFPNRFDAVVTGLDLADPEAGWAWSAPAFQILSLSYQPHHVIAVWPGEQSFSWLGHSVLVGAGAFRGSVVFRPDLALELDRTVLEIENMALKGEGGWTAELALGRFATRRADSGDAPGFAYDMGVTAEGLRLPDPLRERLDRTGVLPETIGEMRVDATLFFDRPLDRAALEDENPQLQRVEIRDISLDWGRLDLRGLGELVADAEGYAEGRIELRARNWREMLELAVGAGAIGAGVAGAVEAGLGLLATVSGDGDSIEVPLIFEEGRAYLGPIAIGDAPRLQDFEGQ